MRKSREDLSESDTTWTASPQEVARGSSGKVEVLQWMVGDVTHKRGPRLLYVHIVHDVVWFHLHRWNALK